jgi:hypothetical protein
MPLALRFGFAAQIVAAFVIFVLGYIALFAALMLALVVARCLYEAAGWLRSRGAARRPVAMRFPRPAGGESERRIPVSSTLLANGSPRVALTFQPVIHRRRVPLISR